MPTQRLAAFGVAFLTLSGCADLALDAPRTPTSLELNASEVTVTEGEPVILEATVLDQHGEPLARPEWAAPSWSTSNTRVLRTSGGGVSATAPGMAIATASVAGVTASATVRVNPSEIALSVDSVAFLQGGADAGVLTPGVETMVRIFMTADRPNYFEPMVRVSVLSDDQVLQSFDAPGPGGSIPQRFDASKVWEVTIPGALVQRGHTMAIVPDPAEALPHIEASERRYPESGALAMRFDVTFMVEAIQLTQSVQRPDGSVPLIAGRDALMRVFATSDADIDVRPVMRATFYSNGVAVRSFDMERTRTSFPRTVDESLLGNSWNVLVPGSLLAEGMSVVVEADPEGDVPRTAESVARFPASGSLSLEVLEVPKLWLRLIPVYQTAFETTGNVGQHNLDHFLNRTSAKFPLSEIDADLRATYSTDARLDTENGWSQLLSEIASLRNADASGRYYYGVHQNPPGAMWGGLGYVGYPAAIGYDLAHHGWETMAHELGHNFGLWHAPCGNPAGVDAGYPYANGSIGVYGYDLVTGQLKRPSVDKDLMTYCGPEWISDYNYEKVMAFRDQYDWTTTGPDAAADAEPALLVWGRIGRKGVILEPAFELDMKPALPTGDGPYRVEGLDDSGAVIFSYRFSASAIDHMDAKSFSFAIPSRIAQPDRLAQLRVRGPEGESVRRRAAAGAMPEAAGRRTGADVMLSWKSDKLPMALVRDAATGEVLSFARNGAARVRAPGRNLEVLFSDGVRSVRHPIIIR